MPSQSRDGMAMGTPCSLASSLPPSTHYTLNKPDMGCGIFSDECGGFPLIVQTARIHEQKSGTLLW